MDDGRRTGKGVIDYPNGDQYEGNFVLGKREGRGRYSFSNGSVYEGVGSVLICDFSSLVRTHTRFSPFP